MAKKKTNADGTPKRQRFDRQGERFQLWRTTSTAAAANAADLPQAAIPLAALGAIIAEIDQILVDQDPFQAHKQLTSQRLKTLLSQGNKLTTLLKVIVRQHYGIGSDKLVGFGIKPLRTRNKRVDPATNPPPPRPKLAGVPSTSLTPAGTTGTISVTPTPPSSK